MAPTETIESPHKKLLKRETGLRVLLSWAEFDAKNRPTIPRSLVPADVIRVCLEALE